MLGITSMACPMEKRMRLKFEYVRSKKLMAAYREIPCQHCGKEDGTVVGAHSNQSKHGKCKGCKASDDKCASLCMQCHSMIDQWGSLTREERIDIWEAAHLKTVNTLVKQGLWPADIPVPYTNTVE